MPYANPEKQKEFQKKWYLKNKKEHNHKSRERYWANHENERLRSKIYYIKNKEKKSQYRKEHKEDIKKWYQENRKELYQKHVKKGREKGNVPIMGNPFPEDVSVHQE